MTYKCIGCDDPIPWRGVGVLCLTCQCGATVFYQEPATFAIPASLAIQLGQGIATKHIDQYVGTSSYTSEIKDLFIKDLLEHGFIWMQDCKQCQADGTLSREQAREKHLAIQEAEQILRPEK